MIVARLTKGKEHAVRAGFPWVYKSDVIESSAWLLAPAGSLVSIEDHKGGFVALGYINPHSQITCRVLTRRQEPIDEAFFASRLAKALALREEKIAVPYYRLVHSEADDLPGLLIDRFGDAYSIQVTTAGMEALKPLWLAALETLLSPKTIIFRNDTGARKLEGLSQRITTVPAGMDVCLVQVEEYGAIFLADLLHGQKTGWFYDQRDNRKLVAGLAQGKTLLDVYSHSGGFGIPAALAGAAVTMVDSSALALGLAKQAAALNHVSCEYVQGDAFEVMQGMAQKARRFDIVLADPPAFVKSKKDFASGMRGYEKVARHAAALVAPGGLLFVASCSHYATRESFNRAVLAGVKKAGRDGKILKSTGAAPDHPRHAQLPQNEYLKGLLLQLD